MRYAILGAGSLGTILGAYIQKGGQDIVLIDANKDHVNALNEKGAKIIGTVEMTVPVKAITPDQMEGIYDVVFYMTKQTHNKSALPNLLKHLDENSVVVTLQNGVPEPAVADYVGAERVCGCPVGWGATWIEPGVSELTSDPSKMTFDLGEYNRKATPRLQEIKKVLELMCETTIMDNLMGIRWAKLLTNATFSGMSAVLGCTFGDILDNEKALECVKHIANETIKVARASGVKMEPIQGYDIGSMLYFENKEEMASKTPYYEALWGPHRKLKASMLQDLEKGKKTEIDALNGVVSEEGKRVNVPTPFNDKVVEIVKGIEEGKYKYEFDNLKLFTLP